MGNRAYNFNAGPAALPLEVLQRAEKELVDYQGIGMSIMEISHRSKEYEEVNDTAQQLVKELLGLPSGYQVMLLQGGASHQFAMLPMNFLTPGKVASFVHTGSWAEKAIKEASKIGEVSIAASSEEQKFATIPNLSNLQLADNTAYLHITSNETIGGVQYKQFPETGSVPLIADMSSDIMSRPIDASKFAVIYAGAQKNLGPSGVTLVIMRDDFLQEAATNIPTILRYDTHAKNQSLYNTPPVYPVYMLKLVLEWVKGQGGLAEVEKRNEEKTGLIYTAIDESQGFYQGVAAKDVRSVMNVTFRMQSEELEKRFVKEAEAHGFVGLKGHRSVGGLRASTYNAVPYESCKALADFMKDFQKSNG